jgi:hypothetical protein
VCGFLLQVSLQQHEACRMRSNKDALVLRLLLLRRICARACG